MHINYIVLECAHQNLQIDIYILIIYEKNMTLENGRHIQFFFVYCPVTLGTMKEI